MNIIDRVITNYWQTQTVARLVLVSGALYEAERAVLEKRDPNDYSQNDVSSSVYYHLHGEELSKDFFIGRQEWFDAREGQAE